jgi:hypothetical protein
MTTLYISLAVGILLLAFGALWHSVMKQGERLKAMGLGIQFLIEKSEQKPNTYVMDRLRDALRE